MSTTKLTGGLLRGAICLIGLFWASQAVSATDPLIERLYPLVLETFPSAERFGPFGGEPRAAPVFDHHGLVGYLYLTDEILPIPAYSGKPISVLVALSLRAEIVGVTIVHHEEPILLAGVSEEQLADFVAQYLGVDARQKIKIGGTPREGYVTVDAVSGATITMMVINQTIGKTLQEVARSRGLLDGEVAMPNNVDPDAQAIWRLVWAERGFRIGILVAALLLLALILLFQDLLVQRPRLLLWVRDGYLLFTVVFIGWYALAQLSVVNVLTFVRALRQDFRWETFLIDPVMFILWTFVAISLLLWGRGVYCGWLCPFGAMQELINQVARRLRIRQWEFPQLVHERLWALKYIILLLLFGVSLQSMEEAVRYAEIEPFKTVVTLRFQREWGYLIYALALLLIAVVNRKFFCKYLCPLGAALAIPARLRLFDWLRRRKECGKPCQVCAVECEVRAISPIGEINANECHYCMDCQITYWKDDKCPPLSQRRRRREQVEHARQRVGAHRVSSEEADPEEVTSGDGGHSGTLAGK